MEERLSGGTLKKDDWYQKYGLNAERMGKETALFFYPIVCCFCPYQPEVYWPANLDEEICRGWPHSIPPSEKEEGKEKGRGLTDPGQEDWE